MKIQFVCSGNTFRSRLAEAYLKSKKISGLTVSSSGVRAERNLNGPICEYSVRLSQEAGIGDYLSPVWIQTTKSDIEVQDLIIFMDSSDYEYCRNELNCKLPNYEIWGIPDVPDSAIAEEAKDDEKIMIYARSSFNMIKDKTDSLIVNQILVSG